MTTESPSPAPGYEDALRAARDALTDFRDCFPVPMYGVAKEDQRWQARAIDGGKKALAVVEAALTAATPAPAPAVPAGEVVVTTDRDGRCVLVSRQDEDGQILSVIWQHEGPYTHHNDQRETLCSVAGHAEPAWRDVVEHAATELAELDDETAQAQAAALRELLDRGPQAPQQADHFRDATEMVPQQAEQPADLMEVVEQILDAGYLNQEDLARLRAAWEASVPSPGMTDAIQQAVAAERERCAKLCEDARQAIWDLHMSEVKQAARNVCENLAARIRTDSKPQVTGSNHG